MNRTTCPSCRSDLFVVADPLWMHCTECDCEWREDMRKMPVLDAARQKLIDRFMMPEPEPTAWFAQRTDRMTLLRDSLKRLSVMRWRLVESRPGSNKIDFSWCGERASPDQVRAVVEGVKPPGALVVYWCMSDGEFDKLPTADGERKP